MKKFVYVVGGGHDYYQPFQEFGKYTESPSVLKGSLESVQAQVSIVLFTGGSDVDPSLYSEEVGKHTYSNVQRDGFELNQFYRAQRYRLPMVGVCRGSQFLCVMAGGKLVQHVTNHTRSHEMELRTGKIIYVSSSHHQMQNPPKDAVILGWATPARSEVYLNGKMENIPMKQEIEIVHYPNINALGIQHHPEYQEPTSDGYKIAEKLVNEFLL